MTDPAVALAAARGARHAPLRIGLHRRLRAWHPAGLLDGKRVATHWAHCARLAAGFPAVSVEAEALYVVDGKVWTSAGVTTGIDMAWRWSRRTSAQLQPT
jgi:transcriptional regulator GlxA family with amidase domain